ncbi:MAG: hypothetical protein ABII12_01590 [Planctomycetota bacterium]
MSTSEIPREGKSPAEHNARRVGRSTARGPRPVAAKAIDDLKGLFPSLTNPAKRFGAGLLLALAQRTGDRGSVCVVRLGKSFSTAGQRPLSSILDAVDASALAKLLGGLAHRDRVVLARALLLGASTHHELALAVKLQTGPLYHHLHELERAGIMFRPDRNTYRLSEVGRVALLVVSGLGSLAEGGGGRWKTKPWRHRSGRLTGVHRPAERQSAKSKPKVR